MKKKLLVFFIAVTAVFLLTACGGGTINSGLSQGTYALASHDRTPQITFDLSRAAKTNAKLGTFLYVDEAVQVQGTIDIKRGYVILTPQNGDDAFWFELKDWDTMVFCLRKSSAAYMADGTTPLADGATFFYIDER